MTLFFRAIVIHLSHTRRLLGLVILPVSLLLFRLDGPISPAATWRGFSLDVDRSQVKLRDLDTAALIDELWSLFALFCGVRDQRLQRVTSINSLVLFDQAIVLMFQTACLGSVFTGFLQKF